MKLFIYGSLQPGGPNEHVMTAIGGEWVPATVRGRLIDAGWGANLGYPGIVIDETAEPVQGFLFVSERLADKWGELDAFEGPGYKRIAVTAQLENGRKTGAQIYVLTDARRQPK